MREIATEPDSSAPKESAAVRVEGRRPVQFWVIAGLLLMAMWIATHPYVGLYHDDRLYSLQALHALHPRRFGSDLFFKYGSQDSFTAFTSLYAPVVGDFGLRTADLLSVIAGDLVWIAGGLYLARTLFDDDAEFLAAAAGMIVLYAGYGGNNIFNYAEPFASPRPYAEGLVMISLAGFLRGRIGLSVGSMIAALLLHPLMALPGAALIALMAAVRNPHLWVPIALGGGACAVAAVLNVGPFGRLMQTIDPAWFQIIYHRSGFAFVGRWSLWNLTQVAAVLLTVALGRIFGCVKDRQLLPCAIVVGAAGLLATGVGGDILRNVFVVNIQPWRALWLPALLANAVLPVVILRSRSAGVTASYLMGPAVLAMLAKIFSLRGAPDEFFSCLAMSMGLLFVLIEIWRHQRITGIPWTLYWTVFCLISVGLLAFIAFQLSRSEFLVENVTRASAIVVAVGLLVVLLKRGAGRLLVTVGALTLVAPLAVANQTQPWERFVLSATPSSSLEGFLSPNGSVYWEGEFGQQLLWFKLHRPSYYSCLSGTGAMFYRATAIDYQRRQDNLRMLNTRDFADTGHGICGIKAAPKMIGPQSRAQLVRACRALPDLDTIVLTKAVPGVRARIWKAPASVRYVQSDGSQVVVKAYYRYDCGALQ